MSPPTVLLVAASLRAGAHTTALLEHAAGLLPEGYTGRRVDLITPLPHYNADLDGPDAPDSVRAARLAVATADALIIATPEYNGSIPGGLKNAIDWITRPPREHPLVGKPVAVISAAPGSKGAAAAAGWLHQTLAYLGARPVGEPVSVADVTGHIDASRRVDDDTSARLQELIDQLVAATTPPGDPRRDPDIVGVVEPGTELNGLDRPASRSTV